MFRGSNGGNIVIDPPSGVNTGYRCRQALLLEFRTNALG